MDLPMSNVFCLMCHLNFRSTFIPGPVVQSVTFLTTDECLTAYPGREIDLGPVPYFLGD